MRKLLQVAILGACVVCGKSGAYVLTGSDVYRLMDGSAEDNAFVVGYVQGFSEAWGTYEVGLEESGVPPLLFCIPDGIKAGQKVETYKAYLRRNPGKRSEPAGFLLPLAMREKWPCKN